MSMRTVIVGILAAICGVTATIGIYRLQVTEAKVVHDTKTKPVVVTRVAIEYGQPLMKEHLQLVNWPAELMPAGACSETDEVVGKFSKGSLVANEPVTIAKLSAEPTYLQLPEGMRAVTLQTSKDSNIVAGLIAAGNRVDVILTISSRASQYLGGTTTVTLLENIEVLAVGQDIRKPTGEIDPKRDTRSVTLMVTPEMAEELNLAAALGTMNLALRSFKDDDVQPRSKVQLSNLFKERADKDLAEQEEPEPFVKSLADEFKKLKSMFEESLAKANAEAAEAKKAAEEAEAAKAKLEAEAQLAAEEKQKQEEMVKKFDIPAGMRAVSIMTPTDANAVAGLIKPGDHVDVILTTEGRQSSQRLSTTTLTMLEYVEVLAVGAKVETEQNGGEPKLERSVTLLVTPEIAQDLSLASKVGTLTLSLRGNEDGRIEGPLRTVNLAELLAQPADVPEVVDQDDKSRGAARPRQAKAVVRINRGGQSNDVIFHYRPDEIMPNTALGAND